MIIESVVWIEIGTNFVGGSRAAAGAAFSGVYVAKAGAGLPHSEGLADPALGDGFSVGGKADAIGEEPGRSRRIWGKRKSENSTMASSSSLWNWVTGKRSNQSTFCTSGSWRAASVYSLGRASG